MNTTQTPTTDLFAEGYRCELSGDTLLITSPEERRYRVHLIARTCSCPAGFHGAPCKHLRLARILAIAQSRALWRESYEIEAEADARYSIFHLYGGKAGWTTRGNKMRRYAQELLDEATALHEWAHQEVPSGAELQAAA